jgi:hypothetical protein
VDGNGEFDLGPKKATQWILVAMINTIVAKIIPTLARKIAILLYRLTYDQYINEHNNGVLDVATILSLFSRSFFSFQYLNFPTMKDSILLESYFNFNYT